MTAAPAMSPSCEEKASGHGKEGQRRSVQVYKLEVCEMRHTAGGRGLKEEQGEEHEDLGADARVMVDFAAERFES